MKITVIKDRYGGGYSRGAYTAWLCDVPEEVDDDDVSASNFWDAHRVALIGLGSTPQGALTDLLEKQTQDALPAPDEACAARIEDMVRSFGYTTRGQSREIARAVATMVQRYAGPPCTKCLGQGYYLSGGIGDPPIQCEACVKDDPSDLAWSS